MKISLTIWTLPVAQPRQQSSVLTTKDGQVIRSKKTGRAVINNYIPTDSPVHQYKHEVMAATREAMIGQEMADKGVPVVILTKFFVSRPAWCDAMVGRGKDKHRVHSIHALVAPHRPDFDNFWKSTTDAMKGLAWHDDAQVVMPWPGSGKFYHEQGGKCRVELTVWTLDSLEIPSFDFSQPERNPLQHYADWRYYR